MRTTPQAANLAAGCPADRARPKCASAVLGRVAATLGNDVSTICSRAEFAAEQLCQWCVAPNLVSDGFPAVKKAYHVLKVGAIEKIPFAAFLKRLQLQRDKVRRGNNLRPQETQSQMAGRQGFRLSLQSCFLSYSCQRISSIFFIAKDRSRKRPPRSMSMMARLS